MPTKPKSRKPRHRSTYRRFTAAEDAMFQKAAAEDDAELAELRAEARADFARLDRLRDVLASLKRTREQAGVTLAHVATRTGIAKGNLSKLENDPHANPTIETLMRYAAAIGVELRIVIGTPAKSKRRAA